jgi:hypothetical protein
MKLSIKVETAEAGAYTVTTDLICIVNWERKFRTKASKLAEGIGMEDLAFLAFEAAKRAGIETPVVFDDYLKTILDIEVVSEETETPTQGAPTDTF